MSCWEEMKGKKVSGKKKKKKRQAAPSRGEKKQQEVDCSGVENKQYHTVWREVDVEETHFCPHHKQFTTLHACLNDM